jgi:hypothetical protein
MGRLKQPRREGDAYYTRDDVALACVRTLPILDGDVVLEPSAGGGAFLRALRTAHPGASLLAIDVNPEPPAALSENGGFVVGNADFGRWEPEAGVRVDWIVGNPPYSDAVEHLLHALSIARIGVAFLLRLSLLESRGRVGFWREVGPLLSEVRVLASRPSFTGSGTDQMAYGWMVFDRRTSRARPALVPGWDWEAEVEERRPDLGSVSRAPAR